MYEKTLQRRAIAAVCKHLQNTGYEAISIVDGYVFGRINGKAEGYKVGAKRIKSLTDVDNQPVAYDDGELITACEAAAEWLYDDELVAFGTMTLGVLSTGDRAYIRQEAGIEKVFVEQKGEEWQTEFGVSMRKVAALH